MSGEPLPEQLLRLAENAPSSLGVPVDQFELEQSALTEYVIRGPVPPQELAQFAWPVRKIAMYCTVALPSDHRVFTVRTGFAGVHCDARGPNVAPDRLCARRSGLTNALFLPPAI